MSLRCIRRDTKSVSPMGTALTEDQMRLLKKFTRRIVLALDPDAAGQKPSCADSTRRVLRWTKKGIGI
ncbi:MAG: toprim domain-containing protein [Anaerolineales bacterium]